MVILLKQHAPQAEQERLLSWLRELGAEVRITGTPERPFFCLTGDISRIDPSLAARFAAGRSSRAPLPMIFPGWAPRGCACSSPPGTRRGFPSCPS